jgi:transposase InsO family protein
MGITVERVLSDNGACYRSWLHAEACAELGMRHLFTRPYRPRTNGKAERFIQTLTNRWAYGAIYGSSTERTRRCPAGSTPTTSVEDTAPSVTGRPRLASPSWNNLVRNYS